MLGDLRNSMQFHVGFPGCIYIYTYIHIHIHIHIHILHIHTHIHIHIHIQFAVQCACLSCHIFKGFISHVPIPA